MIDDPNIFAMMLRSAQRDYLYRAPLYIERRGIKIPNPIWCSAEALIHGAHQTTAFYPERDGTVTIYFKGEIYRTAGGLTTKDIVELSGISEVNWDKQRKRLISKAAELDRKGDPMDKERFKYYVVIQEDEVYNKAVKRGYAFDPDMPIVMDMSELVDPLADDEIILAEMDEKGELDPEKSKKVNMREFINSEKVPEGQKEEDPKSYYRVVNADRHRFSPRGPFIHKDDMEFLQEISENEARLMCV